MPLPTNRSRFTGTQHPTDALFVLQGSRFEAITATNGDFMNIVAVNVFAQKDSADPTEINFCVEQYHSGYRDERDNWIVGRVGYHVWMKKRDYLTLHGGYWQRYDMEPNRDFNIGEGLRNADGEHLRGSSQLVERDGTLKMDGIHANLP